MAILEVCSYCSRLGGYAKGATDKICARCKNMVQKPRNIEKEKDEVQEIIK